MIAGIEALYQEIAESIEEAVNEPWSKAWIDVIFYSEHTYFSGEYTEVQGALKSFAIPRAGRAAFVDIRDKFKEAGRKLWCTAHFEIDSAGAFKMDLGYECDERGFASFN